MPKQRKQPTLSSAQEKQAQRAIVGTALIKTMLGGGMFGMPGQIRLADREQQPQRPTAFVPPKGKRGRGG